MKGSRVSFHAKLTDWQWHHPLSSRHGPYTCIIIIDQSDLSESGELDASPPAARTRTAVVPWTDLELSRRPSSIPNSQRGHLRHPGIRRTQIPSIPGLTPGGEWECASRHSLHDSSQSLTAALISSTGRKLAFESSGSGRELAARQATKARAATLRPQQRCQNDKNGRG